MKARICVGLLAVVVTFGFGCSDDAQPALRQGGGGPAVCEGGPLAPTWTVRELRALGPASNHIFEGAAGLFIVESLQNTVSHYDVQNDRLRVAADLGEGANPYDAFFDGNDVWTANYLAETIVATEASTGVNRLEIADESLKNPAGVFVDGELVWSMNVNYLNPNDGFGAASIAFFDRVTGERQHVLDLNAKNVQYATRVETEDGAFIVVVASGAIEFVDGGARATSDAVIYRWPADLAAPWEAPPEMLTIPASLNAAPGRPIPLDGTSKVYLASATQPHVYAFDVTTMTWVIAPDDPLVLYDADGDALHHGAIDSRGILMVTAFNRDTMQLIDTRCDVLLGEPIPLGVQDELLEGPHGVAPIGTSAYFILSISNALGVVELEY